MERALCPSGLNERYRCPNPENIHINPATAKEEGGRRREEGKMRQSPLAGTEERESMRKGRGRGGREERTR